MSNETPFKCGYTSTILTWFWPVCMNKLLQYLYWICVSSWGIVCNRYVPSNYWCNCYIIGRYLKEVVILYMPSAQGPRHTNIITENRSCNIHRNHVVSQLISRYVNYGSESWLTPLFLYLIFFFIFMSKKCTLTREFVNSREVRISVCKYVF